jgi:hypothetical protein
MYLLNNFPVTSAQVLEGSELIDCLLARVRELRPNVDVENVAETLKYCLTIGYSVSSSLLTLIGLKKQTKQSAQDGRTRLENLSTGRALQTIQAGSKP